MFAELFSDSEDEKPKQKGKYSNLKSSSYKHSDFKSSSSKYSSSYEKKETLSDIPIDLNSLLRSFTKEVIEEIADVYDNLYRRVHRVEKILAELREVQAEYLKSTPSNK
jgi:hypothetical protein